MPVQDALRTFGCAQTIGLLEQTLHRRERFRRVRRLELKPEARRDRRRLATGLGFEAIARALLLRIDTERTADRANSIAGAQRS